jgi:hypothetical protein
MTARFLVMSNRAVTIRCCVRERDRQASDWADSQELGPVFLNDRFTTVYRSWHDGTSFGLNDLEAQVIVVCEVKDWMATHVLIR